MGSSARTAPTAPTAPTCQLRQLRQLSHSANSVILRAVAGSTLANEAVLGVDSATTRGMTGWWCLLCLTTSASARRAVIRVRPSEQPGCRPRGDVAASMARRRLKQPKQGEEEFVPTTGPNRRCGGRVLGETQHRAVEGVSAHIRGRRARPANGARTNFTESPRNPAVQAGFKAHVRSRAKCMPVAPQRGQPQTREAFNLHFKLAKRSTFT